MLSVFARAKVSQQPNPSRQQLWLCIFLWLTITLVSWHNAWLPSAHLSHTSQAYSAFTSPGPCALSPFPRTLPGLWHLLAQPWRRSTWSVTLALKVHS